METLQQLLTRMVGLGKREALRFHNGYRTWRYSYREVFRKAAAMAAELERRDIRPGEALLLWGENQPEWIFTFWGCVARGVVVVPVDSRSSLSFVSRIQKEAGCRLLVHSESVDPGELEVDRLTFEEVDGLPEVEELPRVEISAENRVEIVYTSGTTGDPKGVVHRHRHLCSNLAPFDREISRYRRLAAPFQPIRILQTLPLSHLFGQSMGLFIPVLLEGGSVLLDQNHPGVILRTICCERVSVLVAVPRQLQVLRSAILSRFEPDFSPDRFKGWLAAAERWWRHRKIHSTLGWKFWVLVVGGAQVDEQLEEFWSRLGFLLIQGYGLTETSPVVAVNHPFRSRRGSIGQVLEGQEVRIAEDGEILVRGPNVVSEFVGGAAQPALEGGWLPTGDIGEFDQEGRLYFRGRKKEVIVTSEGMNVFPDDVEGVLNRLPGIRGSVVVPIRRNGTELVHAVLLLDSGGNPEEIIKAANQKLERHQRIASWSKWEDEDFPRTTSTAKVKRSEVARRVEEQSDGSSEKVSSRPVSGLDGILSQISGRSPEDLRDSLKLAEDLGLSSLDRVELMSQIEATYGVELDEEQFGEGTTVGEIRALAHGSSRKSPRIQPLSTTERPAARESEDGTHQAIPRQTVVAASETLEDLKPLGVPRWNRSWPFRSVRSLFLQFIVRPLSRYYLRLEVSGLGHLSDLKPPFLLAANHNSNLDAPIVLAALPFMFRGCVTPAMSQDYFKAYFEPEVYSLRERLNMAFQYFLACALFQAFPLPQRMSGIRRTLRYMGELADLGYCPLVFPEGERSPDGTLKPFMPGLGLMAVRLRLPVLPLSIKGLYEVYSVHHDWPVPGPVEVKIGRPLWFSRAAEPSEVIRQVERAVRELMSETQDTSD